MSDIFRPTNMREFIDAAMSRIPNGDRLKFRVWMKDMGIPNFGHPDWGWSYLDACTLAFAYMESE